MSTEWSSFSFVVTASTMFGWAVGSPLVITTVALATTKPVATAATPAVYSLILASSAGLMITDFLFATVDFGAMSNNLLCLRIGDFALTVSTLPSFLGSPRTRSKFTHFPNSNFLLSLFTFLGGDTGRRARSSSGYTTEAELLLKRRWTWGRDWRYKPASEFDNTIEVTGGVLIVYTCSRRYRIVFCFWTS